MKDTSAVPAGSLLADIFLRLCVVVAVLFFGAAAFTHWRTDPARISLLLIAAVEGITAGIVICSRRPQRRDWRPLSVAAVWVAMFNFLGLDLSPGTQHLLPEAVGASLQVSATLFQLYAKLSLGRSFGILPATRHLVTHGAYRWLRHPIYFGYLIAHVGFLLSNFSLRNLIVLLVLYLAQLVRIRREEEILATFPGYPDYCNQVRYRLIPKVY